MSQSRKEQLQIVFQEIDVNHDNMLSKEELFIFLDKQNSGVEYDREIAN